MKVVDSFCSGCFPHPPERWPADELHSSDWANKSNFPQRDTPNPTDPIWPTQLFFHSPTTHCFQSYRVIRYNTRPPAEGMRKRGIIKQRTKRGWSWEYWCCGSLERHIPQTADMWEHPCGSWYLAVPVIRHSELIWAALQEHEASSPVILKTPEKQWN